MSEEELQTIHIYNPIYLKDETIKTKLGVSDLFSKRKIS
jgi:hypothetical protein